MYLGLTRWLPPEMPILEKRTRSEAWRAALWRRDGPGGQPTRLNFGSDSTELEPLLGPELLHAAGCVVLNNERSKNVRAVVFSVCAAAAAAKIQWTSVVYEPDDGSRSRMSRIIKAYGSRCMYSSYGDGYVNARLRLALPAWSTCTTPRTLAPHSVTPEIYTDLSANDLVRPILDKPIPAFLCDWDKRTQSQVCAAVATVQEMTGGEPALLLNEQLLRHATPNRPALVFYRDFVGPSRLGVWVGDKVEHSADWELGALDALMEWLVAARDMGDEAVDDLASAVLDNDSDSPLYTYLRL